MEVQGASGLRGKGGENGEGPQPWGEGWRSREEVEGLVTVSGEWRLRRLEGGRVLERLERG